MKQFLSIAFLSALALLAPGLYAQETSAEETPVLAAPSYPADTLAVVRLKSFEALGKAFDTLKEWVGDHPSVEALFDDEWQGIEKLDLRKAAAQVLDLTQDEFDSYFEGTITLAIGSDMAWAQESKMLPVAVELTASSADRAKEFVEMLKDEDEVVETAVEAEGVERVRIEVTTDEEAISADDDAVQAADAQTKEVDVFVATEGQKVVFGNSLAYVTAALRNLRNPVPVANQFWARVGDSDAALWIEAPAVWNMVRAQMEAKKAAGGRGMDPKIIEELGLNEMEGLGMWMSFMPLKVQIELSYSPSATGLMRIFTCTPTGVEASALVPADAQEFSLGRADVMCLWTQLRRMAKIAVPATDVIYQGWAKQLEESQGVNIEKQLFGSFGNKYVLFTRGQPGKSEGSAIYMAVNDAVALQGGLDAFFGFFAQGKDFFDKEKIGGVPVWRLKSEFQSSSAPPIAYAITPQWLIVSMGDPTQMQELIEDATHATVSNPIFANDEVIEVLANPSVTTFSHRPLRGALANLAATLQEIEARQQAKEEGTQKPSPKREVPSFDDVKESVIIWNESRPGSVTATIKVISNNE